MILKRGVGFYQKVRNKRLDFQNHDKYTSNQSQSFAGLLFEIS